MFKKVLIANRGEIAVRIAQTLQEMGISAVMIYSGLDPDAYHIRFATEAYQIPGNSLAETYLNQEAIIDIAKKHKVDAIHPGFGFLSENADFAKACEKAGITFIGPSAEAIVAMGDKTIAKETMEKADVPTVPGWIGNEKSTEKDYAKAADEIGYPILVKAAAGGGGKGMRLVEKPNDLQSAIEAAQREAQKAFGDGRIFLEKYIVNPRHIEFQIFGDGQGNAVHLYERECSIQRRHQKIIEESPSPTMTEKLRQEMADAALKAAGALDYTNAGTVEFIVDEQNNFYFLEVNTRLQVEHPVTELVTQQDLVRAQLLVASGKPLPFKQENLGQSGHTIECRIYAEDPANNFLPSTGTITVYEPPQGPFIRCDNGVETGSEVSVHFDPMLSKLIVWGQDRDAAVAKMNWALANFPVLGVTTNIPYLKTIMEHDAFKAGKTHTHFLTDHQISVEAKAPDSAAIIAAALSKSISAKQKDNLSFVENTTPWQLAGEWRALV